MLLNNELDFYEGEWHEGKYHGSGAEFKTSEGRYEGEWNKGVKEG